MSGSDPASFDFEIALANLADSFRAMGCPEQEIIIELPYKSFQMLRFRMEQTVSFRVPADNPVKSFLFNFHSTTFRIREIEE